MQAIGFSPVRLTSAKNIAQWCPSIYISMYVPGHIGWLGRSALVIPLDYLGTLKALAGRNLQNFLKRVVKRDQRRGLNSLSKYLTIA